MFKRANCLGQDCFLFFFFFFAEFHFSKKGKEAGKKESRFGSRAKANMTHIVQKDYRKSLRADKACPYILYIVLYSTLLLREKDVEIFECGANIEISFFGFLANSSCIFGSDSTCKNVAETVKKKQTEQQRQTEKNQRKKTRITKLASSRRD